VFPALNQTSRSFFESALLKRDPQRKYRKKLPKISQRSEKKESEKWKAMKTPGSHKAQEKEEVDNLLLPPEWSTENQKR